MLNSSLWKVILEHFKCRWLVDSWVLIQISQDKLVISLDFSDIESSSFQTCHEMLSFLKQKLSGDVTEGERITVAENVTDGLTLKSRSPCYMHSPRFRMESRRCCRCWRPPTWHLRPHQVDQGPGETSEPRGVERGVGVAGPRLPDQQRGRQVCCADRICAHRAALPLGNSDRLVYQVNFELAIISHYAFQDKVGKSAGSRHSEAGHLGERGEPQHRGGCEQADQRQGAGGGGHGEPQPKRNSRGVHQRRGVASDCDMNLEI